MDREQIRKKLVVLFKKMKKIEEEIQKIQNQLVKQLCPKKKEECEPAYCTFRITDTCPFIKEWNKILEEGEYPKDTRYDDFVEFIEKISSNKGILNRKNT